MKHDDPDHAMAAVAALGDPLRRSLYRYIAGKDHPVSRDEAAEAVGVTRSVAAFHLDRMVDDGLLEVEFRRLTGRRGPGAGRPAKLYRRAAREIAVSLPARRYDIAAGLLAAAVSESTATGAAVDATLDRLAREEGARLAQGVAAAAGRTPSRAAWGRLAVEALAAEGYEPRITGAEIVLGNCPFHRLVTDHPELVCRMNLSLLEGFAAGIPGAGIAARLQPSDGACCVRLEVGGVP